MCGVAAYYRSRSALDINEAVRIRDILRLARLQSSTIRRDTIDDPFWQLGNCDGFLPLTLALLERDRGLPGYYFTDETFFQTERRAVFEKSWMCIGLSADVPAKGDMLAVSVFDQPLLMVRDGAQLRVFHNVCSHRGAQLVQESTRGAPRIVCPYHTWTYRLDGELVSTPHIGGADQHTCDRIDRKPLTASKHSQCRVGDMFCEFVGNGTRVQRLDSPRRPNGSAPSSGPSCATMQRCPPNSMCPQAGKSFAKTLSRATTYPLCTGS